MGILDMYVMATLVINLSNEISEHYLKITEDAVKAIDLYDLGNLVEPSNKVKHALVTILNHRAIAVGRTGNF